MATTAEIPRPLGSSSSAVTPDAIKGAESPRPSIDLIVGLVARSTPAIDVAAYARDVARVLLAGDRGFRWQLAVAHTADAGAEIERMRNAVGLDGYMVEVPFALQPSDALEVPYHGLAGRARALHAIFQEARARGARGCVVLDPHSAAPALWLEHFLQPCSPMPPIA